MGPTALIVFREVLEAALVVSIIMAATRGVRHRRIWVAVGIAGGVCGAAAIALLTTFIAQMFEGVGQDLVNAVILFLATGLIGWHVIWMNSHGRVLAAEMRAVGHQVTSGEKHMSVLAIVVGLAVMREGSEVALMLQGLWTTGAAEQMITGGVLGCMGGVIAGAALYLGFVSLPIGRVFTATNFILVLIAAGMAARAANFLAQAGLISSFGGRVWDTSKVLADNSPVGQFLGALIGYIARPNGIEVTFYTLTIVAIIIAMVATRRHPASPRQALS